MSELVDELTPETHRVAHNRKRFIVDNKVFCNCCELWKELDEFGKSPKQVYGLSFYCKECGNAKAREQHKKVRAKGADRWEKHRRGYRNRYYKLKYGITLEEFEDKLAGQGGRCEICEMELGVDNDSRKAHLDHCHTTNQIRGILCVGCNQGIGSMREDIEIMKKAIAYLEKYNE